jgi:hypothetical protein
VPAKHCGSLFHLLFEKMKLMKKAPAANKEITGFYILLSL